MDTLRKLAPWQIIAAAVGVLVVMLVGGYFLVALLTTTPVSETGQESTVPADLGGEANGEVLKKLEVFETPKDGPLAPQPVETVDPNDPSTVNPFR